MPSIFVWFRKDTTQRRFPAQKFRIPLSSTVIRIAHSVRDARAFSTFLQALLHAFSFERLATFFVWVINILARLKKQAYSILFIWSCDLGHFNHSFRNSLRLAAGGFRLLPELGRLSRLPLDDVSRTSELSFRVIWRMFRVESFMTFIFSLTVLDYDVYTCCASAQRGRYGSAP